MEVCEELCPPEFRCWEGEAAYRKKGTDAVVTMVNSQEGRVRVKRFQSREKLYVAGKRRVRSFTRRFIIP